MLGLKFKDPQGNTVAEIATVDRQITVGRAQDVDVALPFKAVSRYHARFFAHGGVLYVEDLGSSNGVLVNGARITEPTRLDAGDYARIGIINVVVVAPPGAPSPISPASYAQAGVSGPVAGMVGAPPPAPYAPPAAPAPYAPPAAPAFDPFAPPAPYAPPAAPAPYAPPTAPAFDPFAAPAPYAPPAAPAFDPFAAPAPLPAASVEPPTRGRPEGHAAVFEPEPLSEPGTLEDGPPAAALAGPSSSAGPEQPTVALPMVPRLIGRAGPMAGEVVYLDSPELTVGRVKACGLMIEDASVSRNHAKLLRKPDDSFVLFDLRSFNGTWVNDTQVTKAELNDGDVIRFGDVSFQLVLRNEAPGVKPRRKADARRSRLRVVLLASLVVLVVLVVAGNLLRRPEPPPPPPDPQAEARALQAKIEQQLARGEAEIRRRDWEAASATLQGVLKLDPVSAGAIDGLEVARVERERQGWIKEAVRVAETGRDLERAQGLLAKVPQNSTYYAEARVRLRQVNRTVAEDARNSGLSNCRAWRYEECQRLLCAFFQNWPIGEPIPDEVRARRALERAEQEMSRRQRDAFVPCQIPEPGTGNLEADAALVQRYPEEKIRRAVVSYYQGHADEATRDLAALEKNRQMVDHRPTIDRLLQQMIRVETASADCHRDVRADRLDEAASSFEVMEEADTKILPEKLQSHYVREAGKLIADSYHRLGENHYRSGRLRESFNAWSKGKRFAPNHPDVLRSLLVLDGRAREACDGAAARLTSGDTDGAASHFELCRDITPESHALHRRAVEELSKLGR
jgi:pSer/pThr/pTyr-binding forkhead associated (FHA) protein